MPTMQSCTSQTKRMDEWEMLLHTKHTTTIRMALSKPLPDACSIYSTMVAPRTPFFYAMTCLFITHDDEGIWHSITPDHMRSSLQKAALKLKFHEKGIDPRNIGVHSLRAGGSMALKMIMGVSDTIIKKQGCWTLITFLEYIHNQLAIFAKDLSRKMSTPLPYLNVSHFQPP